MMIAKKFQESNVTWLVVYLGLRFIKAISSIANENMAKKPGQKLFVLVLPDMLNSDAPRSDSNSFSDWLTR